MKKTYQFNFRADPDFVERVRLMSTINGQTMSRFVLEAVQVSYAENLKKKPSLKRIIGAARKAQK